MFLYINALLSTGSGWLINSFQSHSYQEKAIKSPFLLLFTYDLHITNIRTSQYNSCHLQTYTWLNSKHVIVGSIIMLDCQFTNHCLNHISTCNSLIFFYILHMLNFHYKLHCLILVLFGLEIDFMICIQKEVFCKNL